MFSYEKMLAMNGNTGTYTLTATLTTTDPHVGPVAGHALHTFAVTTGDALAIDTLLPGGGAGEFVNNLDVGILKAFFLQPPGPSGLVP